MNTVKWCQKLFISSYPAHPINFSYVWEAKKAFLFVSIDFFYEVQIFIISVSFSLQISFSFICQVCLDEGCTTNCIWPGMFILLAFIWFRSWALENQFDPSCFLSTSESMILTLAQMASRIPLRYDQHYMKNKWVWIQLIKMGW